MYYNTLFVLMTEKWNLDEDRILHQENLRTVFQIYIETPAGGRIHMFFLKWYYVFTSWEITI